MPTAPRSSWDYERLQQIIQDALRPFVEDLKAVKSDVNYLKANAATQQDYYRRDYLDQVFKQMDDRIKAVEDSFQALRDSLWKGIAAVGGIISIVVLVAQHIHIT